MRHLRNGLLLAALAVTAAWPQGGRRGAQPPPTAPQGARGAPTDLYNYNPSAAAGPSISDAAPTETQQKLPFPYTTQTGYLPLLNATTGQPEAHVFYTFYAKPEARRPLVMFFGGAPGVAAAWQEFGGLGPKRMTSSSEWSDNPHTLLQQADLVFANPVGTAFSRPAQPAGGPAFWTTDGDIASLASFVRGFLARHGRRAAPLFLAGEDAGTGRVAGLAAYLADRAVPVHGVILLSMTPSADAIAGDWQHINLLPSLVLSAWHHKKLAPDLSAMSLEQIAGQARQFASREYLHALYKGDRLPADERTKVTANLSRLTGLSKPFVTANDLRIPLDRFAAELLRADRKTLALSDSRVAGFAPVSPSAGRAFAPIVNAIDFHVSRLAPTFLTAYDAYLRKDLAYTGNKDSVYYLTGGGVTAFTSTGNDDASLAGAFARNPGLRLFVGLNYFDLSSPFYAAEFTLAHLSVSPEVRAKNITVSHYESGQMPYVDSKALVKLHRDLAAFLDQGEKR
jgi:carboxypeptidase C (cathepsin A)